MGTPIETKNGTAFVVKPGGTTEVLRPDQPAIEIPTADLVEFAASQQTGLGDSVQE
ncbi:hypothetical protein [Achromobacter denitrificans]|uniref:hypothetical protein n=1 Tax=Achromobacter denitrificans TaxID=32002 RepID=UPI003D0572B2